MWILAFLKVVEKITKMFPKCLFNGDFTVVEFVKNHQVQRLEEGWQQVWKWFFRPQPWLFSNLTRKNVNITSFPPTFMGMWNGSHGFCRWFFGEIQTSRGNIFKKVTLDFWRLSPWDFLDSKSQVCRVFSHLDLFLQKKQLGNLGSSSVGGNIPQRTNLRMFPTWQFCWWAVLGMVKWPFLRLSDVQRLGIKRSQLESPVKTQVQRKKNHWFFSST